MTYFTSFPKVNYKFGDETFNVLFPNIAAYVELIDQIKDDVSFYQYFDIIEGDRPDIVSMTLYGSPYYHWTFYFMNDNIREFGWPLTTRELNLKVQKDHPNTTLTTRDNLTGIFLPGQTVTGLTSGETGVILERNLDLGQLVIKGSHDFNSSEIITSQVDLDLQTVTLVSATEEYNSTHHYEDSDGTTVDIDPWVGNPALYTPITYADYYTARNDTLKQIKVIKPEAIKSVVRAFKQEMKK